MSISTETAADIFKSAMRAPAGFHRIQGIQTGRSTLSTAGLYDLYTRYGQSVDKKALLPGRRNYPQVPPQPQGALYRGFQLYKFLLKQCDSGFFHEIWPYHHHHALDLYPDLEARLDPISSKRVLWTVAFTGAAATPSNTIASAPHDVANGTPISNNHSPGHIRSEGELAPSEVGGKLQDRLHSNAVASTLESSATTNAPRGTKKRPGKTRASFGSTWNSAGVRDAAASPHDATSRCWIHAPAPRSWSRAAG